MRFLGFLSAMEETFDFAMCRVTGHAWAKSACGGEACEHCGEVKT
jgi:hypothetical protein